MSPYRDTEPPTDRISWELRQLQERQDATDERLSKGADAFAAMRSRTVWFALGLAGTVLAGALAVGRILQRVDDTANQQGKHESKLESVSEDVTAIEVEQVRLRSSVDGLARSIDRALEAAPKADPLGRRRQR